MVNPSEDIMDLKEFLDGYPNPTQQGYVFALLPEACRDVYYDHIKKAAEGLGLKCESFMDFKDPRDALRDVIEGIQKAEILVYDISGLTPNVMWELGVGLAIKDADKVIVIREGSDTPLPFDIYSHRVSYQYDRANKKSLNELSKTLREVMQRINRASSRKAPIQSPEVVSLYKGALNAIEKSEWIPAQALFQLMDTKEPENWYIFNQWGIMLRTKGDEFEAANEKFNKALSFTDFDDDKVFIYTELAMLNQKHGKYREAEEWFRKAERADSENGRLYISWAQYHDELGDYFNAQAKIAGALGRLKYKEDDPEYKELMLRHEYYGKRIQGYKKTFEQFLREKRDPRVPVTNSRPEAKGGLPYDITWDDIVANHVGSVVEGEISNVTSQHGIFVRLSRDYTGLVFWRNLMEGFTEKFSKNQRVRVRIAKAFINTRDRRGRIDLMLVQ